MGSRYSYSDNEERKKAGLRYDNPVDHEYKKAPSSVAQTKPTHPLKTFKDLSHATFKSFKHCQHLSADSVPVINTIVVERDKYLEQYEYIAPIISRNFNQLVQKIGNYYYGTDNTSSAEHVIIVTTDICDKKQLEHILFKISEFERIEPPRKMDDYKFYSEEHRGTKCVMIPSSNIKNMHMTRQFLIKKYNCESFRVRIIKEIDGRVYKKTNGIFNEMDNTEFIFITINNDEDYRSIKTIVDTELGYISPPSYYDQPPKYIEQPTPSAPPKQI